MLAIYIIIKPSMVILTGIQDFCIILTLWLLKFKKRSEVEW